MLQLAEDTAGTGPTHEFGRCDSDRTSDAPGGDSDGLDQWFFTHLSFHSSYYVSCFIRPQLSCSEFQKPRSVRRFRRASVGAAAAMAGQLELGLNVYINYVGNPNEWQKRVILGHIDGNS